ncbi:MAG: ABC transporter permease, partial [Alphaproteobacteria bacterium]|nr:ABC transporter permease [Alphaproteobacteria bacterium]
MGRFITRRLLTALPVLLLVSLITFGLIQLVPGDPATVIAGQDASPAELARVREMLQLDAPWYDRLLAWYGRLAQGDLGQSFTLGRSVATAIMERAPVTFSLAAFALVMTLAIGMTIGIAAALRQNSWLDAALMGFALVGVSLPNFWLGIMFILVFAVELGWLPSGGYVGPEESVAGWLRCLVLPALSLALLQMGLLARITRASMIEVLRQDYVRTARAKGLPAWKVVGKHALRNVLVPVVTVIGIIFSLLLAGAVVIETVYSIPGIGRLVVAGIARRDYPVIQGALLLIATSCVLLNIVVDILYAYIDPRV